MKHPNSAFRLWPFCAVLCLMLIPAKALAQEEIDLGPVEPIVEYVNVIDADLREVIRGIGEAYEVSVVVDNSIRKNITLRLSDIPVSELIEFVAEQYNLVHRKKGAIHILEPQPPKEAPPSIPPNVVVANGKLSFDLKEEPIQNVLRAIQQQNAEFNIVVKSGVTGNVTGMLRELPVEVGLRSLLENNGFTLNDRDGIFEVDRARRFKQQENGAQTGLWIQAKNGLISIEAKDVPVQQLLDALSGEMKDLNVVVFDLPEKNITAKVDGVEIEEAMHTILRGSELSFRLEGKTLYVGQDGNDGVITSRLIVLDHMRADSSLTNIPARILGTTEIQPIKEHNGLLVTGSSHGIARIEQFIKAIDKPTPQILIEALVIDFEDSDVFELGLKFGRSSDISEDAKRGRFQFGKSDAVVDEDGNVIREAMGEALDVSLGANKLNKALGWANDFFGTHKIGLLPDDFYARINALDQEGKLTIQSRPQVSTINGHSASIDIGTTQYYLLNTSTSPLYNNNQSFLIQDQQRFEKIEASTKLEITPWVGSKGEVTVEIRPEFSSPVGEFDPDVPPTINRRVLNSTVRLRDGETIILGGLIREFDREVHNKVPILGSIPLLGRLFRSSSTEHSRAELVVFVTPYIFYGDGQDDERWKQRRGALKLDIDKNKDPLRFFKRIKNGLEKEDASVQDSELVKPESQARESPTKDASDQTEKQKENSK